MDANSHTCGFTSDSVIAGCQQRRTERTGAGDGACVRQNDGGPRRGGVRDVPVTGYRVPVGRSGASGSGGGNKGMARVLQWPGAILLGTVEVVGSGNLAMSSARPETRPENGQA